MSKSNMLHCNKLKGAFNQYNFINVIQQYSKRAIPYAVICGCVTDPDQLTMLRDRLVSQLREIIFRVVDEVGLVAWWSDKEFVALLPNTDVEGAEALCCHIKDACQEHLSLPYQAGIAWGCASAGAGDIVGNQVLTHAKTCMYRHKLLQSYLVVDHLARGTPLGEDSNLENHARRCMILATAFGRFLDLDVLQLDQLSLFALFHDIGKVAISSKVLQKRGKLNDVEWEEIKQHPKIGYRIAASIPELAEIAPWILSHHERWDGQGYPQGLWGGQVPLLVRILAIVDAYEVMTGGRPYKEPLTKASALAELGRCGGTQFDPSLVDSFVDWLEEQGTSISKSKRKGGA